MTDHRCPDDEMIAAYFDGLLSDAEEARFLSQMNSCPECLQTLASVGIVLRETDSIPTLLLCLTRDCAGGCPIRPFHSTRKLNTIAVRFINDALSPLADALQPTMSPAMSMRSAAPDLDRFEELRFHVSLGDVALEIDLEIDGPDEVALKVTPPPRRPVACYSDLHRTEKPVQSSLSAIARRSRPSTGRI